MIKMSDLFQHALLQIAVPVLADVNSKIYRPLWLHCGYRSKPCRTVLSKIIHVAYHFEAQ